MGLQGVSPCADRGGRHVEASRDERERVRGQRRDAARMWAERGAGKLPRQPSGCKAVQEDVPFADDPRRGGDQGGGEGIRSPHRP